MAFQAPNVGQERKNLKILEQLEVEKKRLRAQNGPQAITNNSSVITPVTVSQPFAASDAVSQQQKLALKHANDNSFGYFITQNSHFGNLILPVLPRFEKQ